MKVATFPDITPELKAAMPELRGRLLANEQLGPLTWFRVGGPAQILFTPADEDELREKYLRLREEGLPPQMVETELVQSSEDPAVWQIASLWYSREALIEYRQTGAPPAALLLFRSLDVEPEVRMYEVVDREAH